MIATVTTTRIGKIAMAMKSAHSRAENVCNRFKNIQTTRTLHKLLILHQGDYAKAGGSTSEK
jgi:hypothetical protein